MPVSLAMVEAIQPHPGQVILDLAAGLGDTGFLAAELIAPGGELITSDFSPEMLSAAQRRAEGTNVRVPQMGPGVPPDQPGAPPPSVAWRGGHKPPPDPETPPRGTP